jgi:hypothetical protein
MADRNAPAKKATQTKKHRAAGRGAGRKAATTRKRKQEQSVSASTRMEESQITTQALTETEIEVWD